MARIVNSKKEESRKRSTINKLLENAHFLLKENSDYAGKRLFEANDLYKTIPYDSNIDGFLKELLSLYAKKFSMINI